MYREPIEKHFFRLTQLVRLEEKEEREVFEREFAELSPEEREKNGKALLRLILTDSHFNAAGHRMLTFQYENKKPLPSFSFEAGDMVGLSKDTRFDADLPFGTVFERTADSITVAFHRDLPPWVGGEERYHLSKTASSGTYRKTLSALKEACAAEHGRLAYIRNVLLGLKAPAAGDEVKIESLRFFNAGLNSSQKQAVKMALESPDLCLIQGPPGTGKTTVLIEIIRQEIARGKFVFATAPSNAACDHILACLVKAGVPAVRLGHPARIMKHLREHTLDYKVAYHPYAKVADEREAELERLRLKRERHRERRALSREEQHELKEQIKSLEREIRALDRDILAQVLREAPVMVGTHAGARDYALDDRRFDVLVMDEAAQATEPSSWIPILKADKVVLAGDHFQLPPTVKSAEAERRGLGVTLFAWLYSLVTSRFKIMLDIQYRMNEKIMDFSSREFYGGRLTAHESVKEHVLAGLAHVQKNADTETPLVFLDTAGRGFEERKQPGGESRYNPEEAEMVIEELSKLLAAGVNPEEIAVISPYSAQTRLIMTRINDPRIEVDSVDSFQGREKEAVILSLVRSNVEGEMGFLTDTRRMNVAMTRARRRLIVIGDSGTLSSISFYQNFIQYAESIGAYCSSWE